MVEHIGEILTAHVAQTPPASPTTPADNIQVSLSLRHYDQLDKGNVPHTSHPRKELLACSSASSSIVTCVGGTSNYNPLDPLQTKFTSTLVASPSTNTPPFLPAQSRIDTIVASVPSTPTHQSHNSSGGVTSHSYHHDHHGGSTPSAGGGPHHQQIQRRAKVYCDKWVHEGVCAFTQQGCKYKHEMPFDKVTQHQLGLFHGLPAWWKKHQAELARQRDAPQGIDSESVLEISDGGGHGGSIMNDGIPGANNDMMRDSISNIQRSRLGAISGSTTAKLAWREQNEHSLDDKSNVNNQSQDRSLFGISNSSGGVGGGLHGGISGT